MRLLFCGGDGATLLVRKRGTRALMQPGGKIDDEELPLDALRRELLEELGLEVAADEAEYMGRFSAPAEHEQDCMVTAEMFRLRLDRDVAVQAEIEEARWIHPVERDQIDLAPLTRDLVLPAIWG